jgi:hypothetical protein
MVSLPLSLPEGLLKIERQKVSAELDFAAKTWLMCTSQIYKNKTVTHRCHLDQVRETDHQTNNLGNGLACFQKEGYLRMIVEGQLQSSPEKEKTGNLISAHRRKRISEDSS